MSSIDKGVTSTVQSMGRNVTVSHMGNYIVGQINGEEVFRIADRYGYINDSERAQIRSGLDAYDRRQSELRARREREEARREREEALRLAREQEERLRREREEAERRQEYTNFKSAVEEKCGELKKDALQKQEAYNSAKGAFRRVRDRIDRIQADYGVNCTSLHRELDDAYTAFDGKYREYLDSNRRARDEADALLKNSNERQSAADSRRMSASVARVKGAFAVDLSPYEADTMDKQLVKTEESLQAMSKVKAALSAFCGRRDETGLIAQEALSRFKGAKVSDIGSLTEYCRGALERIKDAQERAELAADTEELETALNALDRCNRIVLATEESSYSVRDHREKIVQTALEVSRRALALREKGYSTCSQSRILQIVERCNGILTGNGSDESVLTEVRNMANEVAACEQRDQLHAQEYQDYLELVEKLVSFGVARRDIPAFDVNNYARQRGELERRRMQLKRSAEISNMTLTDLNVQNVMESMGYEVFCSRGDADGYVIEKLYTRRGYDGVLWQVITMSDGSFYRRLIGVKKEGTQTDPESIKELARKLEEQGEPRSFIEEYRKATDSPVPVDYAVDHDSPEASAAIRRDGYHYLEGEALQLYESRVAEETVQSSASAAPHPVIQQIRTTAENAIQSSDYAVRAAAAQSRVISNDAN